MSGAPPGMPGAGPQGPMPPVLAALHGGQPGQPPFGSNPMTSPVPNQGADVEAMGLIEGAAKALKAALRILEPGSELFQLVNRTMEQLERKVPPGTLTPGIERSVMMRFMMELRRNNPVVGALNAQGQGGPQGGGQPMPQPPPSPVAAGAT